MTMQQPIPLIKDYNVKGMIICTHINATKNKVVRHKIACDLVMAMANKLDELVKDQTITGMSKEVF